ncbi:unnamed protein product [Linum tenue]|uniref:Uncharacterized protein n=1 Tax=Linum tenue TaxID=586396 RepID=A0AAV0LEK0_9ROSI|nr:unnamed protein product [Linum tenue]CAI0432332.1 unnamed protein product [Linum tenue]
MPFHPLLSPVIHALSFLPPKSSLPLDNGGCFYFIIHPPQASPNSAGVVDDRRPKIGSSSVIQLPPPCSGACSPPDLLRPGEARDGGEGCQGREETACTACGDSGDRRLQVRCTRCRFSRHSKQKFFSGLHPCC